MHAEGTHGLQPKNPKPGELNPHVQNVQNDTEKASQAHLQNPRGKKIQSSRTLTSETTTTRRLPEPKTLRHQVT